MEQVRNRAFGKYSSFDRDRPSVLVVGHERSGNHFLMNTLARAYGYVAEPWFNLDYIPHDINYHQAPSLRSLLMDAAARRIANVGKSHHDADFFAPIIRAIQQRYVIFYVHRDPVDVMLSYWRFIDRWPWREGPKRDDPVAFARAEPEGQMMRYQMRQRRNLLHRWSAHVDGWLDLAGDERRVVVVAYSDLKDRYVETMGSFAKLLGQLPRDSSRPSRSENVIAGVEKTEPPDARETLRWLALEEVGETMQRCGYAAAATTVKSITGQLRAG